VLYVSYELGAKKNIEICVGIHLIVYEISIMRHYKVLADIRRRLVVCVM
jgi:hypothetical protein